MGSDEAEAGGSAKVTCLYCRSVWEGDEDMIKTIRKDGTRNEEGYVNAASQLRISTQRGEPCIMLCWPQGWLTFFQTTAHTQDGGLATRPVIDAGTIEAVRNPLRLYSFSGLGLVHRGQIGVTVRIMVNLC